MGIKEVLDTKLRKMGKNERVDFLIDNSSTIVEFYIKKSHREQDNVAALFDKMADEKEKFPQSLLKMIKVAKEEDRVVELGLASVIGDFLERRGSKLEQEVIDVYADVVDKILKTRITKVSKKLGISKELVKELLVIVPDKEYVSNPKYVGFYINRILRKLYFLSRDNDIDITSSKLIIKLFTQMFESNFLPAIAVTILLERKEGMRNFNEKQLVLWNLLTDAALAILNKLDKAELTASLENFIERRAWDADKGRDYARRIQLSQLPEDYARITKVVDKLSGKEKNKKFL